MACNLPLDPNCEEPRIKTFNSDCSLPQQTAYFDTWNKKCGTYTPNNNCKLPINDADFDCTKPIITDFTECNPTESDVYIEKYNKICLPVSKCSLPVDCSIKFNPNFTNKLCTEIEAKKYTEEYNSKCLQPRLEAVQDDINMLINQSATNDEKTTADQLNKDTMQLYMTDYYYIIIKGILYFVTLGIFIYFFGMYNLINGIKITGDVLKDKALIVKDKALEIKDKVVAKETL
jgi:hypothetical protein